MAYDRIKGITIEIDGDTKKLQDAIRGVNSEIRTSQAQLKDLDKLLKLDPGNTELLKQKYKALGDEIEESKRKLETLKEAEKQMKDANATDTAEWDALQREIAETEQNVKSLTEQMKEFGSVSAQQIAAAGEKLKGVGDKMTSVGKDLTTHVTLPLVAIGTAGAASFAEVDKTMQLTNKTMGNTEEQAEMLSRAMKEAAANSTFGMNDAATATLNFARAGLSAEEAAAALAPAMNLAAGEGGDLDTVSAGLVATINGFHGSFDDAAHYADVFAAACNNSALDVNSLSSAMSVAAPIFAAAGYTIDDAALYMGVMANNGIDADKAANSLKTGIARLVSPAKEGAEMMDKLGISVTNADGSMKDSVTIQRELHDAFAQLSESEQIAAASAIFGKNQMAPWLALINTAPSDVDELSASLAGCAGTTQEMAEAMMSGFGGSIEKLKSSIDVLITSIGEALAPTIQKVAGFIQKLVDKFNALTPKQQETIVKIGLIVAAIGPLLVVLGTLLSSIGSIMTWAPKIVSGISSVIGIGGKLMSGLKALWAVLAANPIVLVIAAVAALVAAFIYLWNNSEDFRNFWINLWEKIKEITKTVVDAIVTFFTETIPNALNSVKEFFQKTWDAIKTGVSTAWNAIKETISNIVNGIKEFLSNAWDAIKDRASSAWNAVKETISGVVNGIKDFLSGAWDAIKDRASNAWDAIKEKASTAWNAIKETISGVVNGIKDFLSGAWDAVKTAASTAWNAVKTTVTTVWDGIKSAVSTGTGNVKSAVSEAWNAVKSTTTSVWESVKSSVSSAMDAVKSSISNGLNSAKSSITNILNGIKSTFSSVWDSAKNIVSNAIEKIKSLTHFHWELPHLKLPHISISGSFSLRPPSAPHFSVQWYKKAMDEGMILNSPTIFGAADGKLLGGGEAGPEAVVGTGSLRSMIQEAVASQTAALAAAVGGDTYVYIGEQQLDAIIQKSNQRVTLRSGGRAR